MKKINKNLIKISLIFVIIFTIFSISLKIVNAIGETVTISVNPKPDGNLGININGLLKTSEKINAGTIHYTIGISPDTYASDGIFSEKLENSTITNTSEGGKTIYNYSFGQQLYKFSKNGKYYDVIKGNTYYARVIIIVPKGDGTNLKHESPIVQFIAGTPSTTGTSVTDAGKIASQIAYDKAYNEAIADGKSEAKAKEAGYLAAQSVGNEKPTEKGDEPVPITSIGATENKSVYKMLVPLPGITCMDSTGKDPNCVGNNIMTYLGIIFKFAIGICAALAVIMLIIYGVVYMGDESVFGKTEAKHKMIGAIVGLLIALGSWALLNTINPDLTGKNGFDPGSVNLKINSLGFIDSDTFTKITGKKALSASEYDIMGRKAAKEVGIPFCAIRVILERESRGNPGAIGFDENVSSSRIKSRRAFINSGIKYSGETFTPSTNLISDKSFINQNTLSVQNTPGLGLDWRFSKGLGLTQITLFPEGYFNNGYDKNPPAINKNYYPTRNGMTPKDLLDPEKNLKAGAAVWKTMWDKCGHDNIYGTWVGYVGGVCTTNDEALSDEATARTEYYNSCSEEDKKV